MSPKRWTEGHGWPLCPFTLWRLISTYRLSRRSCTSARPCSLCNKSGLRIFSLLFKAMSWFTRSSFTLHFFPDVIWSNLGIVRCMMFMVGLGEEDDRLQG